MKKIVLSPALLMWSLFGRQQCLKAQSDSLKIQAVFNKPQLFVAFNAAKFLFHISQHRSYIINPELKLRFTNYAFVNIEMGFTKYQTKGDRRNFTHYLNQGHYLK